MLLEAGHTVVGMDVLNDAYDVRLKHWRLARLLGLPTESGPGGPPAFTPAGRMSGRRRRFTFLRGDTAVASDVRRAFQESHYDAVLNLAARAGVPASFDDPEAFLRANTLGVINVLREMSRRKIRNHVLASTSSVYAPAPEAQVARSKESARTDHPRSPYAATKKSAELLCHSFAVRSRDPVHTTVVRYFTVYGPAGRPDMSIFRFIESAMRGTPVEITGDGEQSRDFTFVDDVARGTILAARGNSGYRVINLGGGRNPTTINALTKLIEAGCRRRLHRIPAPPAAGDMATSMADVSLAKELLGWSARTSLKDGLRRTIAWHRKHRSFAARIRMPGLPEPRGDETIGIIGLGYVGLPLAHSLSAHFDVVGYDLSAARIRELKRGVDRTREISPEALRAALSQGLSLTTDPKGLRSCSVIIVTVPTPVDKDRLPDLGPVKGAAEEIGRQLRHMPKGTIVVYESTVYPGCTEEDCLPVIERASGLKHRRDFHIGYSPERINPGDREHTLGKITKVVAGDSPATAARLTAIYSRIAKDVHVAESIRVAEAAKVIENTQRDLNIALINEFHLIFEKLGVRTTDVLRAAETKWNFLKFRPGLVGGHCIGVDPYYLTHRAERAGYRPEIILAGRRLNDGMAAMFAGIISAKCAEAGRPIKGRRILVLGLSFKEDIPDFRNSKSVDLVYELERQGARTEAFDPNVDVKAFLADEESEGTRVLRKTPSTLSPYAAVVLAVGHEAFRQPEWIDRIRKAKKRGCMVFDLKNAWSGVEGLADWAP
jgi:UDP-N-acetyl-D-galactosamine dehydrogenase